LRQLNSGVEFSDLLLNVGWQVDIRHSDISRVYLELEVSSLAEDLRHKYSKISENNGINNSACEVDSHNESVLDLSLGTEFVSTND